MKKMLSLVLIELLLLFNVVFFVFVARLNPIYIGIFADALILADIIDWIIHRAFEEECCLS